MVGAAFRFIFNYAGRWLVGFIGAFLGTICHLLGDVLTCVVFNPLWLFRNLEIRPALFKANDTGANSVMMVLGTLAFISLFS